MGVPHPARSLFPPQLEKYIDALVNAINERIGLHSIAINNVGDTSVSGKGVELRQISSGPPRDICDRTLDAGLAAVAAPNTVTVNFANAMQDANYCVTAMGGDVRNIATPALMAFGIVAVNVKMILSMRVQTAANFIMAVRWAAVDTATATDQPFLLAAPPQGTQWDDYAAMAAAYGFLAPYNALATAAGLNSITYTVTDY